MSAHVLNFHWAVDGHLFVYDYLPASGSQRIRGYDVQFGKSLGAPRTEHSPAIYLAFERWGSQPCEVIVSTRGRHTDKPQTIMVKLISSTQLAPPLKLQQ